MPDPSDARALNPLTSAFDAIEEAVQMTTLFRLRPAVPIVAL